MFADLGFDTSAVPSDSQGRTLFDSFKVLGAIGLKYALGDRVSVAGSFTEIYYLPMTVTSQRQQQVPSAVPFANGSYASHVEIMNANVAIAF